MIDKKKIREEYKNRIPEKGVFVIKNNKNNKVFLASSMNLHGVLDKNRMVLDMGMHMNPKLQAEWKEFGGAESFSMEVLEKVEIKEDPTYNYEEDLKILEMIWIEKYEPFEEIAYNKNRNIRMV